MKDLFRERFTLITGASLGLGEEYARQIAARGGNVVLLARSKDKLEALATDLRAASRIDARVIALDLAAPDATARFAKEIDALAIRIDHVIANAGFGAWGSFTDLKVQDAIGMVRVNCEALVGVVHVCLPSMIARSEGGVLLIASTASFQPTPLFAVYGASKAFVRSFGEALAEELKDQGIAVSVCCPGPVRTGFQARSGAGIAESQERSVMTAEEVVRQSLAAYEARRIGGGRRSSVVFVPGVFNRAGAAIASVLPNSLVVPMVGRMMKTKRRADEA